MTSFRRKPVRILVIDDEDGLRKTLECFLSDYGFEVSTVDSAEEALQRIIDLSFDLLIVDLRLSGMTGDVMILKAHDMCPDIRFLVHTGSRRFQLSAEFRRIGMQEADVFYKPLFDLNLMVQRIDCLMAEGESDD